MQTLFRPAKLAILCFTIFIFTLPQTASAQRTVFNDGDRVCFVGNSITHDGRFHHNIEQYYVTRFPDSTVHFFNSGISGDVTRGVLNRMADDILIHDPTHVVLMIGMNDVERHLYGSRASTNADTLQRRTWARQTYSSNLRQIVQRLLVKGIKVILQTPSIYDQNVKLPSPNNFGVNDELGVYADIANKLAVEFELVTIDYWDAMNNLNDYLQTEKPASSIIGPDRVHPGDVGHFIMANQFLEGTNAPRYVSYIHVDKQTGPIDCLNCTIGNFASVNNSVSFDLLEAALPFVTNKGQDPALDLVEFTQYFNAEELVVENLRAGTYKLFVDGVAVGQFTDQRFREGVNLAVLKNAAQYKQSEKVNVVLTKMWTAERKLRDIKWVEYGHLNDLENHDDLTAVKAFLDKRLQENYVSKPYETYFRDQFANYLVAKPMEESLKEEVQRLNKEAYIAAKPVTHVIRVMKIK